MPSDSTILVLHDTRTWNHYCAECADGEPLDVYDAIRHALKKPHNADTVIIRRHNRIKAPGMAPSGAAVPGGPAAAMTSQLGAWESAAGREVLVLLDDDTDYYYCMECADGSILGHPPKDDTPYLTPYDEDEVVEHALGSPHGAKTAVIQKVRGFKAVRSMSESVWRANLPEAAA